MNKKPLERNFNYKPATLSTRSSQSKSTADLAFGRVRLKKGGEREIRKVGAREMGEEWGEGRSRLCCTFSPGARCADVLPSAPPLQQWPRGGRGPSSPTLVLPFAANIEGETQKRKRRGKKGPPLLLLLFLTLGFAAPRGHSFAWLSQKKALPRANEEGRGPWGGGRKLRGRSTLFARRFLAHARGKRERERRKEAKRGP